MSVCSPGTLLQCKLTLEWLSATRRVEKARYKACNFALGLCTQIWNFSVGGYFTVKDFSSCALSNISGFEVFEDASLGYLEDGWLTLGIHFAIQPFSIACVTRMLIPFDGKTVNVKLLAGTAVKDSVRKRERLNLSNCSIHKEYNLGRTRKLKFLHEQVCILLSRYLPHISLTPDEK